jgi:phosphatidate cytidylyltransferase
MLRQRLIFGSLMILALAGLVWADGALSRGAFSLDEELPARQSDLLVIGLRSGFLLTLLIAVLAGAAALELGRLCEAGGFQPLAVWAAIISAGLVCLPWIRVLVGLRLITFYLWDSWDDVSLAVFLLCTGFVGVCIGILARKKTQGALATMAVTLFIMFYVGVLASFAIRIRYLQIGPAGAAALVFFILTVKFGDIGAFFVGSAVGRHKLAPWLSPGKTWEGAVGAVLGSVFMAELGLWLWSRWTDILSQPPLSVMQAVGFAVLMAVFGHVGDLIESAIKRSVGTKDSGNVLPAFGGLLDLFDSPLFTAPIAWWYLTLFGHFGIK